MSERDVTCWRAHARQCALGIGLKGDDLDDAEQSALCDLLVAWDKPTGDPEGYYKRVVQHSVIDYQRSTRANVNDWLSLPETIAAPDEFGAVERAADAKARIDGLRRVSLRLSDRQRDVMERVAAGDDYTTIAKALGTSRGSIKWSVWAARQRLSD